MLLRFFYRPAPDALLSVYVCHWPQVPRVGEMVSVPNDPTGGGACRRWQVEVVEWHPSQKEAQGSRGVVYVASDTEVVVDVVLIKPEGAP